MYIYLNFHGLHLAYSTHIRPLDQCPCGIDPQIPDRQGIHLWVNFYVIENDI